MKQLLSFLLLIGLLGFNRATSPERPEFRYTVSGNLVCDSLTPLVNYTVSLYGHFPGEKEYYSFSRLSAGSNTALALTDSSGRFYFKETIYYDTGSLKLALIRPGYPFLFSPALNIASKKTTETVVYSTENNDGCGFGSGTDKRKKTMTYVKLNDVSFDICP